MPTKKRATAKVVTKKRTVQSKKPAETKRFVIINEYDPDLARKERAVWVIVGGLAVILVGFWIWTFGQNQTKTASLAGADNNLGQTLGDTAQKVKDSLDQAKEKFTNENADTITATELAEIKNNVIGQIEENMNNNLWSQYDSSILNLSLKYPKGWQLSEKSDIITLTFDTSSTTPTSTDSKIEISETKKNSFKPASDWLKSEMATSTSALTMTKYIRTDLNNNIDWLITFADRADKNIYQISIKFSGGKNIYEPLIEKFLSTINFLK